MRFAFESTLSDPFITLGREKKVSAPLSLAWLSSFRGRQAGGAHKSLRQLLQAIYILNTLKFDLWLIKLLQLLLFV
jgi:hypothetical protein